MTRTRAWAVRVERDGQEHEFMVQAADEWAARRIGAKRAILSSRDGTVDMASNARIVGLLAKRAEVRPL